MSTGIQTTIELLATAGTRLRLVSDVADLHDPAFPVLAGAYVPDARICSGLTCPPAATLFHRESGTASVCIEGADVTLSDRWGGRIGDDAYHLLYAMARTHWLGQGRYPAHAACLEVRPGQAVLLAGPSGCGKTAVALQMMARPVRPSVEDCMKLLSGNKTVLEFQGDSLMAIGGTRTITLATRDVCTLPFGLEGITCYGERTAGLAETSRMSFGHPRIVRIVFPHLHHGDGRCAAVSPLRALHMLHPVLLDAVNADVVLAGGAGTYLDGCPVHARQALGVRLVRVLGGIEVVEAWGSPASIADMACT